LAFRSSAFDDFITVMTLDFERRHRRSDDTILALHYQLAYFRRDAGLEAVVLADPSGVLVAGAGAWPVCEELAAYAPLLADGEQRVNPDVADAMHLYAGQVVLKSLQYAGQEILLAAFGQAVEHVERFVDQALSGCQRILDQQSVA
jgi:hypothetical protein